MTEDTPTESVTLIERAFSRIAAGIRGLSSTIQRMDQRIAILEAKLEAGILLIRDSNLLSKVIADKVDRIQETERDEKEEIREIRRSIADQQQKVFEAVHETREARKDIEERDWSPAYGHRLVSQEELKPSKLSSEGLLITWAMVAKAGRKVWWLAFPLGAGAWHTVWNWLLKHGR
jgi:hypothetical protein